MDDDDLEIAIGQLRLVKNAKIHVYFEPECKFYELYDLQQSDLFCVLNIINNTNNQLKAKILTTTGVGWIDCGWISTCYSKVIT